MGSDIAVILFTFLAVSMSLLSRSQKVKEYLASLIEKPLLKTLSTSKNVIVDSPGYRFKTGKPEQFQFANGTTLNELIDVLSQLSEYKDRSLQNNNILMERTKRLTTLQIEQLQSINYFDKIVTVNNSINSNNQVIAGILKYTLEEIAKQNKTEEWKDAVESSCASIGYLYNTSNESITNISKYKQHLSTSSNISRVNEAISHLCRDWSSDYEIERRPIEEFLTMQLNTIQLGKSSLVVMPGSGVGYVPYLISKMFQQVPVDSIEWSGLMYICNQFALGYNKNVQIRPFCQHYSGQTNVINQTRPMTVSLENVRVTDNLTTLWGDFREYEPRKKKQDKIVVITAYFIDTAEDLFEYIENIERMKLYCEELHWINIGPLKYGTRPKIQLTADELKKLRSIRGWEDLYDERVTAYEGLNGYLTDYKGLYQGYYGLVKTHSTYKHYK